MEHDRELRRRFGVDDWPEVGGERLFIADVTFGGRELEGYRLHRVSSPDVVGGTGPGRALLSVWQRAEVAEGERPEDAILLVDIVEAGSREQAADALLGMLGQFQSPLIARRDGPGEVAFGHGDGAIAFLRGNLAVRVLVGGPGVESAVGPAEAFDASLVARPDTERTRLEPEFVRPPTAKAAKGGVTLDVEVRDPQGGPLMLKIFTTSGRIVRVDGRLYFRPDEAGRHSIEVYAVRPDGDAARAEVVVDTP